MHVFSIEIVGIKRILAVKSWKIQWVAVIKLRNLTILVPLLICKTALSAVVVLVKDAWNAVYIMTKILVSEPPI